jgi:hypothetical protein
LKTTVDIGVACAGSQSPKWWIPVFNEIMQLIRESEKTGIVIGNLFSISSALPDHNKNNIISQKKRLNLTDSNRQAISKRFLESGADWLFQIDDDTIPPPGTIPALVSKGREFIAGVYFLPGPPHNPIAYMRQPDGLYFPVWNYPEGALIQVDSVGMGCTLIHRSVFEKIKTEHELYQRLDGTLYPLHKKQVKNHKPARGTENYVKDGVLHMPVTPQSDDDNRPWPFFALEYGRTEDHYFCELAANVGIRPWLDTTLQCAHIKMQDTTVLDYKRSLAEGKEP